MTSEVTDTTARRVSAAALGTAPFVAGLALELLLVSLLYNHRFVFECRAAAPTFFCAGLSGAVLRAIAATAMLGLIVVALPQVRAALTGGLRRRPDARWMAVNVVGFLCVMAPWFFLRDGAPGGVVAAAAALWLGGAALAGTGAVLALTTPGSWANILRAGAPVLPLALVVALLSPEIAAVAQRIWLWSPITYATFYSAETLLRVFSEDVTSVPEEVLLGVTNFTVRVGKECSGVEGIVLISSFVSFYLYLFRAQLAFPRALFLLPAAVAASWMLNVVRIVALIRIGADISPSLAVNGFHSHAGWLMFTLLAMTLILAAHATPWLRRQPVAAATVAPARRPPLPLRADWSAARLLPFIVFMLTALLSSTFFEIPSLAYPARFIATLAVLAMFWPLYRALPWRLDPLALGSGLAIGVIWLATTPAAGPDEAALDAALAAAPGWAFAIWAVTRVLGTALVVPLVEELLFRDYLLRRLNFGGVAGVIVAVVVSTALFAALHGRWEAAALAGLVFAALALRQGRVTDAVVSHAVANATIAAWAVAQGDWSVI